jgi:hypothetical protein
MNIQVQRIELSQVTQAGDTESVTIVLANQKLRRMEAAGLLARVKCRLDGCFALASAGPQRRAVAVAMGADR